MVGVLDGSAIMVRMVDAPDTAYDITFDERGGDIYLLEEKAGVIA